MRLAVYGAGKCGEYVMQEIKGCTNSKIEGALFIDNNTNLQGRDETPVISLECFMESYCGTVDGVLVAASDELTVQEMVVSLLNRNYQNIYLLPENVLRGKLPILEKNGNLASYIKHISRCKPILPYVEYHVSDYCNLKCKRCGHFSNLVTEKLFPDIEEFRIALAELGKRFQNIKKFRLMGGEPFINPDLRLFIYEVRKAFPYADISIVSNGLLLPHISEETAEAVRDCGAIIDISQYPPTRKIIGKILKAAEEKNLNVYLSEKIDSFFKSVSSDMSLDYEKIYKDCGSRTCHFLRNGRLYFCPAVSLLFEYKDFLGLDIKEEEVLTHSFDLKNSNETGWEMLKKMLCPFEFCKHCTQRKWYEWSFSDKIIKKEDWLVLENEN